MESIKEQVALKIKSKKEEVSRKYDEKITQLNEKDNICSILELITDTFGNSNEQREMMIPIIKQSFQSKFAKSSEINTKPNYIVISDGKYFIFIPTSNLRSIELGRHEILREPKKPAEKTHEEDFIKYYENYKKNDTKENYSYLVTYYIEDVLKERVGLFNKRKITKVNLEEYYKKCLDVIGNHKEELSKWNQNMEKFNSVEIEDLKFLEDTKEDLVSFVKNRWNIKYKDLNQKSIQTHTLLNKEE